MLLKVRVTSNLFSRKNLQQVLRALLKNLGFYAPFIDNYLRT